MVNVLERKGIATNGISYSDSLKDGKGLWFFNLSETKSGTTGAKQTGSLSFKMEYPTGKLMKLYALSYCKYSTNVYRVT